VTEEECRQEKRIEERGKRENKRELEEGKKNEMF
jgi:hypothetical protein